MLKALPIVLLLCILPILVHPQLSLPGSESPIRQDEISRFTPTLSIDEALIRVEDYLREKRTDLSEKYIHSVQLYYDDGLKREGYYWLVQWMGPDSSTEREPALRIYMDGVISQETSEP